MDAQLKAVPILPVQARTVSGCVNSANLDISQHFSTFYGPSVQSMDTQLGARQGGPTPAVHRDLRELSALGPADLHGLLNRRCSVHLVVQGPHADAEQVSRSFAVVVALLQGGEDRGFSTSATAVSRSIT